MKVLILGMVFFVRDISVKTTFIVKILKKTNISKKKKTQKNCMVQALLCSNAVSYWTAIKIKRTA